MTEARAERCILAAALAALVLVALARLIRLP